MIRKKPALDAMQGGNWFSEKIMPRQNTRDAAGPRRFWQSSRAIKNPRTRDRGLRKPDHAGLGSRNFEIFRRSSSAVRNEFVFHRLALVKCAQAGAFDGRDVNEHILVAGGRLDEPVALGRIEPLDGAFLHRLSPKSFQNVSEDAVAEIAQPVHFHGARHKPDFGEESEAGKTKAILSARQHRPEGQNPIALQSKPEKCGATKAVRCRCVADLRKISVNNRAMSCCLVFGREHLNVRLMQSLPQAARSDREKSARDRAGEFQLPHRRCAEQSGQMRRQPGIGHNRLARDPTE